MRILLVTERLTGRSDEGIKNVASALLRELGSRHEVLALTSGPKSSGRHEVRVVSMNRFFLNAHLLRLTRSFRPSAVLYVPWTSGTPRTFWRAALLRLASRAKTAVLLTQPYEAKGWERVLNYLLRPDLALVQSGEVLREMDRLGCHAAFISSGVDLNKFRIRSPAERAARRLALGVEDRQRVILHVGHLNRHRIDAAEIGALARDSNRRVVIVGSTDTPQDSGLVHDLTDHGVTVIRDYVPDIEALYAAADVYLFPTRSRRSSIGVPLSVLEALACGVPVVSMPFEGLPYLFPDTPYVRFADSTSEIDRALSGMPAAAASGARALVSRLGWGDMADRISDLLHAFRTNEERQGQR